MNVSARNVSSGKMSWFSASDLSRSARISFTPFTGQM